MRRPRTALVTVAIAAVAALVVVGGAALLRIGPFATPGPAAALPAPRFAEDTASSGLAFTYDGPFVYAVGGGVAVFDCDDDGRPDIYLAGGEGPAAIFRNTSATGAGITFERVADPAAELEAVNGAYAVDVDNDGIVDLITLRYGENVALRGLGGCRFERANEAWHLDGGDELTEAFSATWERGATWPTLAFGNYADPASQDFATWCQANELVPAGRWRGRRHGRRDRADVRRPAPAHAGVLRPVDAVQRLGWLRPTGPADQQRPALLRAGPRPGAALADRAGRRAAALLHRRRLDPRPGRGHGDRQSGPHRRRPARDLSDQPGCEQAPDARRRRGDPRVQGHRPGVRARTSPTRSPATTWTCPRPRGTRSSPT